MLNTYSKKTRMYVYGRHVPEEIANFIFEGVMKMAAFVCTRRESLNDLRRPRKGA